jgi:hypothetical protein
MTSESGAGIGTFLDNLALVGLHNETLWGEDGALVWKSGESE